VVIIVKKALAYIVKSVEILLIDLLSI